MNSAMGIIITMESIMRRITLFILVIALYMIPTLEVYADDQRGFIKVRDKDGQEVCLYENSYALLIGVSEYTNGWHKLPGVKNDIPLIKTALEEHGFKVIIIENPTYEKLDQEYRNFINKYGQRPDDRLLLYFSGHGHTMKLAYGADMGYIVPADAPNPNLDQTGFLSKAMSMQQIEVYAKQIQSKHAIFMFDSCFSGSIFDITRAVPANISYKTSRPVRQIITAGDTDETVPDRSIFCQQFIEALKGEGDTDKDGYITGMELGEFLQKKVTNYSKNSQHPQYGKIRDQFLDKGDLVFQIKPTVKQINIPTIESDQPHIDVRNKPSNIMMAGSSFMLPGLGQYKGERYISGTTFMVLSLGSLVTSIIGYLQYNNAMEKYDNSIKEYHNASNSDSILIAKQAMIKAHNDADNKYKFQQIMIITTGSVWAINTLHSLFVGPAKSENHNFHSSDVGLNSYGNDNSVYVALTYHF
ncbi:TPA: caspase family protein [bacterium]|nr:caspase family protein [bacterium]